MNTTAKVLTGCGIGCAVIVAAVVIAFAVFVWKSPDIEPVAGAAMAEGDLEILRDANLLEPEESILYFYSPGFLSIAEGGSFFTDRRVVAYDQGDTGDTAEQATYSEIASIEKTDEGTWLDDAVITVTRTDGSSFLLLVSTSMHSDEKFLNRLTKEWQRRRPSATPLPMAETTPEG